MIMAPKNEQELDEAASEPGDEIVGLASGWKGDIVVAGAGGKMGFHLCLMLRKALDTAGVSNRIFAVSRFGNPRKKEPFESRGIETISCDLTADRLENLPDAASVFFLAGQKFGTSDSPETLRLFNEEMPRRVAERYANSSIVALSTGCVYLFVKPESGGSKESDPVGPVGDYAESCLGRETAFQSVSEKLGTSIALIRLNYSVDLRYGVLVDIAEKVYHDQPVDVTMGYLNCIWQGDATRHIIRSMSHAEPFPNACIMNVTGSQTLSVRETAQWFGKRFQKDVTVSGTEGESAWLNNAEKSHQLFGSPSVSEETLMEWVAQWIEQGNPLLGKATHFEVRDGKY